MKDTDGQDNPCAQVWRKNFLLGRIIQFSLLTISIIFLSGCPMSFTPLDEKINGTLSFTDSQWGPDRNGYYFIYDTYHLPLESGKQYTAELWSPSGHSIWFEGEIEGDIFNSRDYTTDTFTSAGGKGEYYIYTRGVNLLDGDIEYSFRVTEN